VLLSTRLAAAEAASKPPKATEAAPGSPHPTEAVREERPD